MNSKNVSLLEVIFPEGNPEETYILHKPFSNMTAYHMERNNLNNSKEIEGIYNPGVYVLFGNNSIYIGQTRHGIQRMETHNRTKDFWEYAILFLADPKDFTLNIISGLERYMIEDALINSPYTVYNREVPQYSSATEFENSIIKTIYDEIKMILHFHRIRTEKNDNIKRNEDISIIKRFPSGGKTFSFEKCNIPIGSTLVYKNNPEIKVTVVDDGHIKYNDEIASVSAIAKKLKNTNNAVSGFKMFLYNGKTLDKIRKDFKE